MKEKKREGLCRRDLPDSNALVGFSIVDEISLLTVNSSSPVSSLSLYEFLILRFLVEGCELIGALFQTVWFPNVREN
jgi:hypothetical protein